jgi:glycosyltransferase involved in cell wall biosynthesis
MANLPVSSPGPRIIAYLEDFPVRDDALGFGLSRVTGILLDCLGPRLAGVVIHDNKPWWDDQKIHPAAAARAFSPRWMRRLAKGLGGGRFAPSLHALWARTTGTRRGDLTFAVCGADPATPVRAAAFARRLGTPLALYLVDNFFAATELSTNQPIDSPVRERTREALRSARHVFAITPGLADWLRKETGGSATVLPLPFAAAPPGAGPQAFPPSRTIVFAGNPSHFYREGLRELASAITQFNRSSGGEPLRLRMTLGRSADLEGIFGTGHAVSLEPAEGPGALAAALRRSLACYLPYSGEEKFRSMTTTSFPSKLLEYLAHGRAIICHATCGTTARKYFEKNGLQRVVAPEEPGALAGALEALVKNTPDWSADYRRILDQNHAPTKIASILSATFANDS